VTTYLISQLHLSPIQTKPFNPILGETYQIKIGDLDYYSEQVANKPPTAAFYGNSHFYNIYGTISLEAKTGANSIKATKYGKYIVKFKDGYEYELNVPQVIVKGLNIGKRQFNFRRSTYVIDKVRLKINKYFLIENKFNCNCKY
jgi:hypothetical protein